MKYPAAIACALLLAGCSAKLYHTNGNIAASVPWPQQAVLNPATGIVSVEPAPGTVQAAQQFATTVVQTAPQLVMGTVQAYAAYQNR